MTASHLIPGSARGGRDLLSRHDPAFAQRSLSIEDRIAESTIQCAGALNPTFESVQPITPARELAELLRDLERFLEGRDRQKLEARMKIVGACEEIRCRQSF